MISITKKKIKRRPTICLYQVFPHLFDTLSTTSKKSLFIKSIMRTKLLIIINKDKTLIFSPTKYQVLDTHEMLKKISYIKYLDIKITLTMHYKIRLPNHSYNLYSTALLYTSAYHQCHTHQRKCQISLPSSSSSPSLGYIHSLGALR